MSRPPHVRGAHERELGCGCRGYYDTETRTYVFMVCEYHNDRNGLAEAVAWTWRAIQERRTGEKASH
jgi:hypothetical protein